MQRGGARGIAGSRRSLRPCEFPETMSPSRSGTGACRRRWRKQAGGAWGITRSKRSLRLCEFPGSAALRKPRSGICSLAANAKGVCDPDVVFRFGRFYLRSHHLFDLRIIFSHVKTSRCSFSLYNRRLLYYCSLNGSMLSLSPVAIAFKAPPRRPAPPAGPAPAARRRCP